MTDSKQIATKNKPFQAVYILYDSKYMPFGKIKTIVVIKVQWFLEVWSIE